MDKLSAALALLGIFALAGVLSSVLAPVVGYEMTGYVAIAIVVAGAVLLARRARKR